MSICCVQKMKTIKRLEFFLNKQKPLFKPWVLTILQDHPVGNFRHKHKTIKCEVAGVGIIIKYLHIS